MNELQSKIVEKVISQKCRFDSYEPAEPNAVTFVLKAKRKDDPEKLEQHVHVRLLDSKTAYIVTSHYVKVGGSESRIIKEEDLKTFFKRPARSKIIKRCRKAPDQSPSTKGVRYGKTNFC